MGEMIVVDMDPGIDDIYALIIMIYAHKMNFLSILFIVCSFGNTSTHNTCKNVLRILEVLNIDNIPVYKGVQKSIVVDEYYFGKDGFGDIKGIFEPDLTILNNGNAAEVLYNLAKEHPHQITLVSLGPVTFSATALLQYDILLKDIWILGGNSKNVKEVEFNFKKDPEAAYSVLNKAKVPIHMLTFQTCTKDVIQTSWRRNLLGKIQSPLMNLLNQAEEKNFLSKNDAIPWVMCDPMLAAAIIYPEIIKSERNYNVTINLNWSDPLKGLVVYHPNKACRGNVKVIEKIDIEKYKYILFNSVLGTTGVLK